MKNKKGQIQAIIVLFLVIVILMAAGIGLAFVIGMFNEFTGEFVPVVSDIGQVGDVNFTEISDYSLTPVKTIGTSFNWLLGFAYVIALFMIFGLAFSFRFTGNKWLVVFFTLLFLALLVVSIIFSNAYEEFYTGTDVLALQLQAQPLMSYLIIYAPYINAVIFIIAGVIMFTGNPEEFV